MTQKKKKKDAKDKKGARLCLFPGYRWCGPGCSGPGKPINDLDAACKKHDECYKKYGLYCKCDQRFLRDLRPIAKRDTEEGAHAWLLFEYMKRQAAFTCHFLNQDRTKSST